MLEAGFATAVTNSLKLRDRRCEHDFTRAFADEVAAYLEATERLGGLTVRDGDRLAPDGERAAPALGRARATMPAPAR